MRKFKKSVIIGITTLLMCASIVGCGTSKGHEEVLEDVKNGTYEIASTDDANPVIENASDGNAYAGWVVETSSKSEMSEEIKTLADKIDEMNVTMYIGYKVEDNTVRYAFAGRDNDNKKMLVYVIQDTDKKITKEVGDYDDIDKIYTNGGNGFSASETDTVED
ncbi:MAG: hypothetical protein VZS44_08255 [Bacilli bacterium]|nr:hypothetical protein [Bacilli bacterium]